MISGINKRILICFMCVSVGLCIFFSSADKSYASNYGKVFLSCDKYAFEKGEEFEVVVNIENSRVAAFSSFLYFDVSKVEFVSGPDNINVIDNRIVYVWHDVTGGNNGIDGDVARFKFRAKDNGIANFVIDGEFYNQLEELIDMEFKHLQVSVGDSKIVDVQNEELGSDTQVQNANLKVLRLGKEGVVPNFQEDIYEYYLTVLNDVKDIDVIAISDNPNATVEITGNTDLKDGLNTIMVKVFSEDRTQNNVYKINVTKTSNLELANTNLEILAIENVLLYPQFESNVTNYKAEISNGISNINILAIPENESATVQINKEADLKEGDNFVSISVIAPNNFSKKEYKVNVYKRNLEEENKYQENLKANQERLNEIYETEKVNVESEKEKDKQEQVKRRQRNIIIFLVFVIIIVSCVGIFYLLKKKSQI